MTEQKQGFLASYDYLDSTAGCRGGTQEGPAFKGHPEPSRPPFPEASSGGGALELRDESPVAGLHPGGALTLERDRQGSPFKTSSPFLDWPLVTGEKAHPFPSRPSWSIPFEHDHPFGALAPSSVVHQHEAPPCPPLRRSPIRSSPKREVRDLLSPRLCKR